MKPLEGTFEVNNESDIPLWVKLCESEMSGRLYIHIGTEKEQIHGEPTKVDLRDYAQVEKDIVQC